jgi:DNA-binding IclR family transcriptional regulator
LQDAAATTPDKLVDSVRAVDRALDILLAFQGIEGGLSVAELLKRVDLSRPTLYRLLRTLEGKGFVVSAGDPQRFRLGPAVAQLAHAWNASLRLADVAEPAMRRVWEATGETVALFVPEGLMRLCVAEVPSQQALSFKRGVGYRERLMLGASGRSILAQFYDSVDLGVYAEGLQVDLAACRSELAKIRRRGFAVSRDELMVGAVAVAAPIFDGANLVAGSLGVFGPTVRLPEARVQEFARLVIREAATISAALGQGRPGA